MRSPSTAAVISRPATTRQKISRGTLKVVGRFKSRHSAAGTLNWKVKTRKGNHTCKSGNVHFTAHNP